MPQPAPDAVALVGSLCDFIRSRPDAPHTLAALGRYRGVGDVMGWRIYGFLAWWVWRTYYMLQMPRLERRLRVLLDWTVGLFFKNDVVKLDFYAPPRVTITRIEEGAAAERPQPPPR